MIAQAETLLIKDFEKELEDVVVKSLTTSFGLDFLLFQDKKGGDVDTVRNVRNGIWATGQEKDNYDNRGDYKATKTDEDGNPILNKNGKEQKVDQYHSDPRFRNKAKKTNEQKGEMYDDAYQNKKNLGKDVQLDHIISSNEIHNDAGCILAELDGVDMSLQDSNLAWTHSYINNKKSNMTMQEFVEQIPKIIGEKKNSVANNKELLKNMPEDTPEQLHKKRKLEDKIKKEEGHIAELESCDREAMLKADKEARKEYNKKISWEYYTSSKFFKNTAIEAGKSGIKMGTRQALGLILAEMWFELKEQIPIIYKKQTSDFSIKQFLQDIMQIIKNIWKRIKIRFNDVIETFKESSIGGIISSLTTTILNIFITTEKIIGKLIREMWNNLVSIIKLIFFNPDNLTRKKLFKASLKLLSAGVAVVLGSILNAHLSTVLVFPFGDEFAAFLSALATGIMTLAFGYFIDGGSLTKLVWNFLNNARDKYSLKVDYMCKINSELDRYLLELAKTKLNMNPFELKCFSENLSLGATELEKHFVIKAELERRGIDLPYEKGNANSIRSWLQNKYK